MSLLQYLSVRTGLLAGGIPSLPVPPLPPAVPDPPRRSGLSRDVTVIKNPEPSLPESVLADADDDCDENSSRQAARNQFRARTVKGGNNGVALRQYAEATLGGGSLRKVVKLPDGEDENEWFAVNMVDFYNQINLLYGAITEFCSPQSCPEMKATDEFEYLWQDNDTYKRPTHMSAPLYIEHLMTWVQNTIDNETLMPSRIGQPFPKQFPSLVRQIFKRMYRVYAHVYCHHYAVIRELGLEPHLNTSFKQYVLFVDEHKLASGKDFYGPLNDLAEKMIESD
ncbi:maintenance of ploidy protein mob1 [Colletotrichum plurivorum]|uniref:Maintenance of ploidy protein mob1 n=1 Tax=Colletotrichum plurivorum TaxID=2175906 RepID=A0A8H6N9N9_9PEZI|nr:maintenance of ploidy protein mob1 [Colletotrichum plurivorum]